MPNMILPHGSYLLNLGSPNPELRQKSLDLLVDELERCEALGILLFNIHPGKPLHSPALNYIPMPFLPGSTVGKISRAESIRNIADGINAAHLRTEGSGVRVVLENKQRWFGYLTIILEALFMLFVLNLIIFHSYILSKNITTWECLSWPKVSYLQNWPRKLGSPFDLGMW